MKSGVANLSRGIPQEAREQLAAEFLDDTRCRQWFLNRYYPDGLCCPDCGAAVVSERSRATFIDLRRFTCGVCGSQPKATKGTVLQDSPFTPRELFLLAVLIDFGVDDREIARILRISRETAASWRDKLAALAEVGH